MKKKFLYEKTSPFLTNRNEISIIKSEKEKDKFYFKTDYYFNNECPAGKECKNYTTILKLECKIKKLKKIIEELKNTNQYLCFTMDQKEKIFKNLVNDIEHFPVVVKKNNSRKKSNNKNSVININNNNNNKYNNNNNIEDNFFKEKKIFKISLNKKIYNSSKKTTKKFITFFNTKNKENKKDDDLFNNNNNNNILKTNYNNYNNNYNFNINKNNESKENNENNSENPNFIRKKKFTRINTISFNKTGFFH